MKVDEMYELTSKLIIYRDFGDDCILFNLSEIIKDYDYGRISKEDTIARIYGQIHKLLDIATRNGFDENLWHDYLSYLIADNENPFTLTCEKAGASEGSVNSFAKNDYRIFKALFDYDFSKLEAELGIHCFQIKDTIQVSVIK